MNITEEKDKQKRVPMVDLCYYCLCRSCINNTENITITLDELPYNRKPCFFCDTCRNFDKKNMENMERTECSEYAIDNYHAEQNRKKIRIVK